MSGSGIYSFKNGSVIKAKWNHGVPREDFVFVDVNGKEFDKKKLSENNPKMSTFIDIYFKK